MSRFCVCAMLCALVLIGNCKAEDDLLRIQVENLELDALEQAVEAYLGEVDLADGVSLDAGLSEIFESGKEELGGIIRRAVKSGMLLLCVVLFMCKGTSQILFIIN